jgi:hypothetical protein
VALSDLLEVDLAPGMGARPGDIKTTLTYLHLIRGAERRAIDALEPATGTILAPQHGSQPNISNSRKNPSS